MTRRGLLAATTAGVGLAAVGRLGGLQASAKVVVEEPFADVVELGAGVWAIASKPFASRDFKTVCNGGIVAGEDRVLVVEGFNTVEGAAWVADTCRRLTGRRPTDAVVTHFHSDHIGGLAGLQSGAEPFAVISSAETRRLILERYVSQVPEATDGQLARGPKFLIPDAVLVEEREKTVLDLGGRSVTLLPLRGHTPSDLAIRVEEPAVIFAGDLAWTAIFPNFADAIPSELWKSCDGLLREKDVLYVPGHGELTDAKGLEPYLGLLQHVESAARAAHEKGTSAGDAWQEMELPESLGEWMLFRPDIVRPAFEAWYRELG